MRSFLFLALSMTLSACATTETARRITPEMTMEPVTMPPMATFSRVAPTPPKVSNAVIARDFLDLAFTLENEDGSIPVNLVEWDLAMDESDIFIMDGEDERVN